MNTIFEKKMQENITLCFIFHLLYLVYFYGMSVKNSESTIEVENMILMCFTLKMWIKWPHGKFWIWAKIWGIELCSHVPSLHLRLSSTFTGLQGASNLLLCVLLIQSLTAFAGSIDILLSFFIKKTTKFTITSIYLLHRLYIQNLYNLKIN